MEDRLSEVFAAATGEAVDELQSRILDSSEDDAAPEPDRAMQAFFGQVGEVRDALAAIGGSVERMRHITDAGLIEVDTQKSQAMQEELNTLIASSQRSIQTVRRSLEAMEADTNALPPKHASRGTRTNMHATLTKKFMGLVRSFQEAQTDTRDKFHMRLKREIRVVQPGATVEEIDEIMESPNPNVFMQQYLQDQDQEHSRAQQQLLFITERHQDILRLERSIQQLHQLFVDMAVLVEKQGELVDQIEHSVSKSVAYTEAAKKDLALTIVAQKKGRRKKCIIIVIIVVVVLVIIGPVIGTKL